MNTSFISVTTAKGQEILVNMAYVRSVRQVSPTSKDSSLSHWCELQFENSMHMSIIIRMEMEELYKQIKSTPTN